RHARARDVGLLDAQSSLRARNIEAERLPAISVLGQGQYQSDVPMPPAMVPGGQPLFSPSKDTYDASVRVDQRIFDPSSSARMALERATLAESQARVRTTLFALKTEVNESFFAAALLQEQLGALKAATDDLEGRLREAGIELHQRSVRDLRARRRAAAVEGVDVGHVEPRAGGARPAAVDRQRGRSGVHRRIATRDPAGSGHDRSPANDARRRRPH